MWLSLCSNEHAYAWMDSATSIEGFIFGPTSESSALIHQPERLSQMAMVVLTHSSESLDVFRKLHVMAWEISFSE